MHSCSLLQPSARKPWAQPAQRLQTPADLIVNQDIMRVAPELLGTQVLATCVGGKAVFERKSVVP